MIETVQTVPANTLCFPAGIEVLNMHIGEIGFLILFAFCAFAKTAAWKSPACSSWGVVGPSPLTSRSMGTVPPADKGDKGPSESSNLTVTDRDTREVPPSDGTAAAIFSACTRCTCWNQHESAKFKAQSDGKSWNWWRQLTQTSLQGLCCLCFVHVLRCSPPHWLCLPFRSFWSSRNGCSRVIENKNRKLKQFQTHSRQQIPKASKSPSVQLKRKEAWQLAIESRTTLVSSLDTLRRTGPMAIEGHAVTV